MSPMNREALSAVAERIDACRDNVIELQTELTRRPALGPESGGEGEKEKAEYLERYLAGLGFRVDRYNSPDDRVPCGYRPNLVITLEGAAETPRLWIIAHTDVVPPGDVGLWSGDPWTVRVDGDKLIGRGVEDNQSGLVSAVVAVKAFKEAGVLPLSSIGVALVADEETGSKHGLRYLLDYHGELFGKNDLVVVPDSGNRRGTEIEVAEKSILWIKIRTIGRQTHASIPESGINAHRAAAWFITRMETLHHRFRKRNSLFAPPISTFEPTKREANVPNVNTIPGEDVVYFDCRVLPEYKLGDVVRAVRALARETEKKYRVKIKIDYPQKETAAPPTDPDAPVALAIRRAVRDLRGRRTKTIGVGGGTVAKYLREAGLPSAVWATMDGRAHTPDEYALIPHTLEDAKVFAHIALQDWAD
jgi:succinyl-diaminopimelate desuccinylase